MGADCKSVAKASKVRILHLPPPAQTAPDLRKRRSGAVPSCPAMSDEIRASTAIRGLFLAKKTRGPPRSPPQRQLALTTPASWVSTHLVRRRVRVLHAPVASHAGQVGRTVPSDVCYTSGRARASPDVNRGDYRRRRGRAVRQVDAEDQAHDPKGIANRTQRAAGLTAESADEQNGAGLDRLSDAEYAAFERVNNAYRDKFGFPYIVCVRRHTRDSVLRDFETPLRNIAGTGG